MTTSKQSHLETIQSGLKLRRSYLKNLRKAEDEGVIDIHYQQVDDELSEIETLIHIIKKELATIQYSPKTKIA